MKLPRGRILKLQNAVQENTAHPHLMPRVARDEVNHSSMTQFSGKTASAPKSLPCVVMGLLPTEGNKNQRL
jgi:hypothetical protein